MRPYQYTDYPRPDAQAWERFLALQRVQLKHLLTAYGTIDRLWFDGGREWTAEEWRSAELESFIRELQPGILINDRLPGVGDYETPEQAKLSASLRRARRSRS
jgi:alpha-L-fucosidase